MRLVFGLQGLGFIRFRVRVFRFRVYRLSSLIPEPNPVQAGIRKRTRKSTNSDWVAVQELFLNYYIGEAMSMSIYAHCGSLI